MLHLISQCVVGRFDGEVGLEVRAQQMGETGGGVGVGDPREGEDARRTVHCPPVVFVPHVIPAQRHPNHPLGGGCRSVGLKKINTYTLMIIERKTTGGGASGNESRHCGRRTARSEARANKSDIRA